MSRSRRIAGVAVGACIALVAGAGPGVASDTSRADTTPDTLTIDLSEQVREQAGTAIKQIPVIDLAGEVGAMTTDGTTFRVTMPAGTYLDGAGEIQTYAAAAEWVCEAQANNPHRSNGAGGVIAKGTVSCSGSYGTIPIIATMLLGKNSKNSTSGMKFVAEETYTQNVSVNLGKTTWYVPASGKPGVAGGGWFKSSIGAAGAPPITNISIGAHASEMKYIS